MRINKTNTTLSDDSDATESYDSTTLCQLRNSDDEPESHRAPLGEGEHTASANLYAHTQRCLARIATSSRAIATSIRARVTKRKHRRKLLRYNTRIRTRIQESEKRQRHARRNKRERDRRSGETEAQRDVRCRKRRREYMTHEKRERLRRTDRERKARQRTKETKTQHIKRLKSEQLSRLFETLQQREARLERNRCAWSRRRLKTPPTPAQHEKRRRYDRMRYGKRRAIRKEEGMRNRTPQSRAHNRVVRHASMILGQQSRVPRKELRAARKFPSFRSAPRCYTRLCDSSSDDIDMNIDELQARATLKIPSSESEAQCHTVHSDTSDNEVEIPFAKLQAIMDSE